jgi:alpha-L-fucosidase
VFLKNAIDPSKPIIGQIYDIWTYKSGGTADGLTVCWFLYPEQTVHKASTKFMEKEVLKSNQFVNYSVKDVSGKCWILQTKDYLKGRPKEATFNNTFVCESRYNDQAKNISKIKNWLSAVPEAVRGVEPDLELFETPLVPVKVLSSLAESLAVKKESEEVYEEQEEETEEEEEEEPEHVERRGRPRRSAVAANPVASTPVAAPEKKVSF